MPEKTKDRTLYIQIPALTHRAIKVLAAAEDKLLSEVVVAALEAYLAVKRAAEPLHVVQPKPPRRSARTGPGSPGYVAPVPKAPDVREKEEEDDDFPPATDEDNPFDDSVLE